jgi:hypothetical protein
MTKLFEWIYQKEKKWTIFCNGKNLSTLNTKREALLKGRDMARTLSKDLNCLVDLIVQDTEGDVEILETYGRVYVD